MVRNFFSVKKRKDINIIKLQIEIVNIYNITNF